MGTAPCAHATSEQAVTGEVAGKALFRDACESCRKLEAIDDVHAPATYRQHLAAVLSRRALEKAHARLVDDPGRKSARIRSNHGRDAQDRADRQRQALRGGGRGALDARRFRAPPARAHRHPPRLRARRVRLLHHPDRRALGTLVPDAGGASERARHSHRRRHRTLGRRAAPAAAGVPRAPWPAVRVLHARNAHHADRVPARQSGSRPSRRCGSPSPAICAGAPVIRASSPPPSTQRGGCAQRRRHRHDVLRHARACPGHPRLSAARRRGCPAQQGRP